MVVKTFKGLLADGGQDRIRLSTIKGKVGYRIVKLQVFPNEPGEQHQEHTVKVYKTQQTTIDNTVDFTDSDLLATAYYQDGAEISNNIGETLWFEEEVFNQDIYVTAVDTIGSQPMNYYLGLEIIPLDDKGAEYTTVKDLRTRGF